jgi:hypothetical protein
MKGNPMRTVELIPTVDGPTYNVRIKPEAQDDFIVISSHYENESNATMFLRPEEAIEMARILLTKGLEAQQWRSERKVP